MNKIISFNLADNFILRLADLIEETYLLPKKDMSGLAVVFGGKRPALFLKKELSSRIKNSFLPPKIFSIDEFIEYAFNKKEACTKVQDLDACYLIYKLAKEVSPDILKGRQDFSQFLPWAREILSFIEQLDLEGIDDLRLKNVELKASIGYDVPASINSLLKDVIALRRSFHQSLKDRQAYSRGLIYYSAARSIKETDFPEFEKIIFANFFYLHRTEAAILKDLYQRDKASLVFQGDDRQWSVLDDLARELGENIRPQNQKQEEYKLNIYAGFDRHSQAGLVREIVKAIKKPQKAVVVLPEPESVIPLISEISSSIEDFNVSLGYPLKRSSIYTLFTAIFKAQETKKDDGYYARDYLKVLAHPLIKNLMIVNKNPGITRVLLHKVEEVLTGIEKTDLGGSLFIRLCDIQACRELFDLSLATMKNMDIQVSRDELKEVLNLLHKTLFLDWEKLSSLSGFAKALGEFLGLLVNKSLVDNYPLNLKMLEKIFTIKEEFEKATFGAEEFSLEDIFKIFDNKLENEFIRFSGSPLKGLQILGILETRSLNFDDVVIMDCNEAMLPKLKIYEPLIPREIMISLGLNRLEKEEEIQRYQFMSLISSARNVHLVYARDDKSERSRFIEELIWQRQKNENKLEVISIPEASFKVKVLPKKIEIKKDARMIKYLQERQYSASSLDTYLHCPLRFYYQYILGLEEKEDLLQEPEARDVGNFLHGLLEEGFARFINKKPVFDKKFKQDLDALFEKKFEEEFLKKMRSDSFLIKEILGYRLKLFLANEEKRSVKEILSLEKALQEDLEFLGRNFRFKARIDRVDKLSDNSILIIDYKTGSTDIMPDEIEKIGEHDFDRQYLKLRIKSFQLPLYLLLMEKYFPGQKMNACLYNLRELKDDLGVNSLFRSIEDFKNKDRAMALYREAIAALLKEILDPNVMIQADDSDPHTCDYCPFFYLCR